MCFGVPGRHVLQLVLGTHKLEAQVFTFAAELDEADGQESADDCDGEVRVRTTVRTRCC
jgi:hypothetical protein